MDTKDDFVRKMHSKLDLWNTEIDKLIAKSNHATADARIEYNKQIEVLKAKHVAARSKLDELQRAGDHAWEDLKSGVELAWNAIGEAIDLAKSRFK